jgi:hypothetical protein
MNTYTLIHTGLSLIALASGLDVLLALIQGRVAGLATPLYLATAVAASATGFGFPFVRFLPSHAVGILSLLLLGAALYARYRAQPTGGWRTVYAVAIGGSVFFLAFVTVAQAFAKVAALKALAPTQKEPPFAVAELVVLAVFVAATLLAVRGMRRMAAVSGR